MAHRSDLSARAGISYETLRALRAGSNPSEHTERALEDALQWTHGSVRAVLNGDDPATAESRSPMDQAEADATHSERKARELVDRIQRLNQREQAAVEALIRSLQEEPETPTGKGFPHH